jgi:hypothetical protein
MHQENMKNDKPNELEKRQTNGLSTSQLQLGTELGDRDRSVRRIFWRFIFFGVLVFGV